MSPDARPDVKLTPRQAQGQARMVEMLEVARATKGDAFGAVVTAGVQARLAMRLFDASRNFAAPQEERSAMAHQIMDCVRQLARDLALRPGELGEALKHARVVHREAFER